MFELKILLEKNEKLRKLSLNSENFISKNIITLKETSDKSETLYAEVKIFRAKTENLSLTEKYEFFRFLPINRSNIIFIVSIPINMTTQDFYNFIDKHIKTITFTRFVYKINKKNNNNLLNNFFQAILYFENQNSADNFYYVNIN